jgi:hypothetical protein
LTQKYNQASAVNFFGETWGLPRAFSGHMTYYLWGPPKVHAQVVIAYGIRLGTLRSLCGELTEAAQIFHPLAAKAENGYPVYVCRFLKRSLEDAWPEFKRFDHLDRNEKGLIRNAGYAGEESTICASGGNHMKFGVCSPERI